MKIMVTATLDTVAFLVVPAGEPGEDPGLLREMNLYSLRESIPGYRFHHYDRYPDERVWVFYSETSDKFDFRIKEKKYNRGLTLIFDAAPTTRQIFPTKVEAVEHFFGELGFGLYPSYLHLATDYTVDDKTVKDAIRTPHRVFPKEIEGDLIFGSRKSAFQVSVYDKAREMKLKKGIKLTRTEVKHYYASLRKHGLNSLEDIRNKRWLFQLDCFSFRQPNWALKNRFRRSSLLGQPLWKIKWALKEPAFWRDYTEELRDLMEPTRALFRNWQWR